MKPASQDLRHEDDAEASDVAGVEELYRAHAERLGVQIAHRMFAAYNAGPARYMLHLRNDKPLPLETRRYVLLIAGRAPPAGSAPAAVATGHSGLRPPIAPMFAIRPLPPGHSDRRPPSGGTGDRLFIGLGGG